MKTIVLVGAGHAHLEIIARLSRPLTMQNRFILISPQDHTFYSALIPRFIIGDLPLNQLTIPSAQFATAHGCQFLEGEIVAVDLSEKNIYLADGTCVPYDILSLNVGGAPRYLPSAVPQHTIYIKPFQDFFKSWRIVEKTLASRPNPVFVIVGGGPAALEISTALMIRLSRNSTLHPNVHLVTGSDRLCANYSLSISNEILNSVTKLGIQVHFNETVARLFDHYLLLKDGAKLAFDSIWIATPNEPVHLEIRGQPQPNETTNHRATDANLRLAPEVFAAGDFVSKVGTKNLPKSGVIALHQGRYLARAIVALIKNDVPPVFNPPPNQLNILLSGPNQARAIWGTRSYEGTFPMTLKNWIDDRYMRRFN